MLIDEFFGETNAILKDTQLREIARIRNENNITVTKLKRQIDGLRGGRSHSVAGLAKSKGSSKTALFVDNEAAIERRNLISDLEHTKSRLRACEAILAAGSKDKLKFMEGAQWISKKLLNETIQHSYKI